jgi:hypothetical protein
MQELITNERLGGLYTGLQILAFIPQLSGLKGKVLRADD